MTSRRPSTSSLLLGLALTTSLCLATTSSARAAAPEDDAPADDATDDDATDDDASDDTAAPEDDAPADDESPVEPEPEPEPEPEGVEQPIAPGLVETEPETPPVDEAKPAPSAIGDKHSIAYTSLLAPRINPLGLEERLWIGYQYRLYNKDKTILNGSNIAIFARPILSPAIAVLGATLQVQPAAVLRLRATYSFVQWFGNFQYMQSYKSPYDDYSETRLDGQADFQESNYVTNGHQVELEALVQARYKGLVIRSATFGIYNHYDLRGDDDVFYAVRYELMVPGRGWLLTNDSDMLWLQDFKGPRKATAMVGARATTLMPFFKKEVYEEGDDAENNPIGPQFRLGPVFGYTFYNRPERRFNKPTLLLIPQWNIKHRWRSGRDVSTAYPTIVIAFVFSGQLWGKN